MFSKLTLLVAGYFSGASNITDETNAVGGLRGLLNGAAYQINLLIDTLSDGLKAIECGELYVGTGGSAYTPPYGSVNSWLVIDGMHAPTVAQLDFIDATTGVRESMTISSGAVVISP